MNNLIMHLKVSETWDQDKAPKQQVEKNTIRTETNEKEETKRPVGRVNQTNWCYEKVNKTDETFAKLPKRKGGKTHSD